MVTDASDKALAGVLFQDQGKGLQPVAFESRKFKAAELNYAVHEKEILAIIHCLKLWKCYVLGRPLKIITDHKSIIYLETQAALCRRQARWMEFLQEFKPDLTIEYKPGKTNVADPFSRRPDLMLGSISAIVVDQALKERLAEAYLKDARFLATAKGNDAYTLRHGIWYHMDKSGRETVALPNDPDLVKLVLEECHDNPLGGYFCSDKTTERVRRA